MGSAGPSDRQNPEEIVLFVRSGHEFMVVLSSTSASNDLSMNIGYSNNLSLVIYLFPPFAYFAVCLIKFLAIHLISSYLISNFTFNAQFGDICH